MTDAASAQADEPELDADEHGDPAPAARRAPWIGVASMLLGLAVIALVSSAYVVALDDAYEPASVLVYVAVGASVLGAALGLVAILANAGRWWGAAGLLLSVGANPLLMVWTLRALAGMTA